MKDLIKEIENCKLKYEYDGSEFDCKRSVFNEGIGTTINWLKNEKFPYNIITSPKQIMLSEILGKLNNNEWKDFQITSQENVISIDNNNNFRQYFNIDKGKITDISEEMQTNEYKWLYALWIAGSEIIDDLEDKYE